MGLNKRVCVSKKIFEFASTETIAFGDGCYPDTFIGIGYLNHNNNNFVLKEIICDKLSDTFKTAVLGDFNLNPGINKVIGYLDNSNSNSIITIKDEDGNTITLEKDGTNTYDDTSEYLTLSSFIKRIPILNNTYDSNMDVCYNSTFGNNTTKGDLTKCYIQGVGEPMKGDTGASTYGTGCAKSTDITAGSDGVKDICDTTSGKSQFCFINRPTSSTDNTPFEITNMSACNTTFDITRDFNTQLISAITNQKICPSLEFFNTSGFNSVIIMYVDNLRNIQTLNYEYFGQGDKKSNLIMQHDKTNIVMKELLEKYRNYITNSASDIQLENALSLTNCLETQQNSTGTDTYSTIINNCQQSVNTNLTNTENNTINSSTINPLLWKINKVESANNSSCTFSLNSSDLYTKDNEWVKYAEFDPMHNKTNMSLYKGGTNQSITFENSKTLIHDPNNYILLSGNLKTSNPKKFLIPSNVKSGFYNDSSIVNLQNNVNNNGKWLILGFTISDITNLTTKLVSIKTDLTAV